MRLLTLSRGVEQSARGSRTNERDLRGHITIWILPIVCPRAEHSTAHIRGMKRILRTEDRSLRRVKYNEMRSTVLSQRFKINNAWSVSVCDARLRVEIWLTRWKSHRTGWMIQSCGFEPRLRKLISSKMITMISVWLITSVANPEQEYLSFNRALQSPNDFLESTRYRIRRWMQICFSALKSKISIIII